MELTEVEVTYCGVDHSQYFLGGGTAYTDWDYCSVGAGSTPKEAMESALEELRQMCGDFSDEIVDGVDTDEYRDEKTPDELQAAYDEAGDGECELYCYAVAYGR